MEFSKENCLFSFGCVKVYCCIWHPVDWSVRRETPAGGGFQTTRGSLSAWSGNQQAYLTEPFVKKSIY
jgi:hypothetical protein